LIEDGDQITHNVDLLDPNLQKQDMLDIFRPTSPEQFAAEEAKWKEISADVLGLESGDEKEGAGKESDSEDSEDEMQVKIEGCFALGNGCFLGGAGGIRSRWGGQV
jgi:hypothetical protein